jgi:hypothetical protein
MDIPFVGGKMSLNRSRIRMSAKSTFGACALVLAAAFAAVAQDRLPTIDLQQRCRASAASTQALLGEKTPNTKAYESCMRSEQEARTALVAAWKDIPPSYRARCIKPNVYSPSYVEWIACLELEMDVKRLRSKQIN